MKTIESFKARFLEIKEAFENGEDEPELIYELEDELQETFYTPLRGAAAEQLKQLKKEINQLKIDYDFYDPEAELDSMFPNRHDDDFDEDSMF